MKILVDVAKNYKGNKLDFIHGAEWMQARMIENACKYLDERLGDYLTINFVELFKQAMEE